MRTVREIGALREAIRAARVSSSGESRIGFVPTMGYLHAGHTALMERAASECDVVVASIFVNPTQFGPGEDLESYPRDLEGDAAKAEAAGVDLLFYPEASQMYPSGDATWVTVERLTEGLCGAHRPEHFRGVSTVVTKLFMIVQPDRAYFGRKDYQQLAVIRRMVRDLHIPVDVVGVETVREADGLAMSSRNAYLSAEERAQAVALNEGLGAARAAFEGGERRAQALIDAARAPIEARPLLELEYLELVDPDSLEPRTEATDVGPQVVMAMAVQAGGARLIDNALFEAVQP